MPGQTYGPVILRAAGDTFTDTCRILALVWTGATTAGDICELRDIKTGLVLWTARTPDTNTYLGINLGPKGVGAPFGFKVQTITAGTSLLVYLLEL